MLQASNRYAKIEGMETLKGLSLTVNAGEVHAIMGTGAVQLDGMARRR